MEGREIGKGLIALAQRWKVKNLDALEGKLKTYLDREVAKAQAAGNESKEQAAKDRVETLQVFIDRCRQQGKHTLECVVTEITNLFADNVSGMVTLASGHKAKGREWGRVYWLQHSTKTKRALQTWEVEQEKNLNYVLGSRVEGVHGAGELWLVSEAVQRGQ
jgi:superfamily I DNA/RNA helicase